MLKNIFWAGRVGTFLGLSEKTSFWAGCVFWREKYVDLDEIFFYETFFPNRHFIIGAKTPFETYQLSTPTYPRTVWGESEKYACKIREARISRSSPSRGGRTKTILGLSCTLTNEFLPVFAIYQLFLDADNINRQPHNLVLISHGKYFSSVRRSICIEGEKQVSHISRNKNKQTNHPPSIPVIGQQKL